MARDDLQLAAALMRAFPNKGTEAIANFVEAVMPRAKRSSKLAETACNRQLSAKEQAEDEANDAEIRRLCKDFGVTVRLNGDPRGFVVKFVLPDGRSNDMGGEEWGIG